MEHTANAGTTAAVEEPMKGDIITPIVVPKSDVATDCEADLAVISARFSRNAKDLCIAALVAEEDSHDIFFPIFAAPATSMKYPGTKGDSTSKRVAISSEIAINHKDIGVNS